MAHQQQATFAQLKDLDNEINDLIDSSILARTWKSAITVAWAFFIIYQILIGIISITYTIILSLFYQINQYLASSSSSSSSSSSVPSVLLILS